MRTVAELRELLERERASWGEDDPANHRPPAREGRPAPPPPTVSASLFEEAKALEQLGRELVTAPLHARDARWRARLDDCAAAEARWRALVTVAERLA